MIPSKPSPALNAGSKRPTMLCVSMAPAIPAIAPPATMAMTTVSLTGIPAYQAAFLFLPTVSMRNPEVVLPRNHHIPYAMATAMKNPNGSPRKSGIRALS
ncbi:unannotated protein [freshwater metagenome]|uniref:Unannotated protein n=1 Tax=freshwater metagenome TaxID=449393 RepID=A0A6J6E7J5_9ZZZZ